MILCGKKLKIFFLSFLFLGLGIFSALDNVNAAITITALNDAWDNSNIVTIPEHSENAAVFCVGEIRSGDSFSFSLDGVNSTALTEQRSSYNDNPAIIAYTTTVPDAGNYSWTKTNNGTFYSGKCFIADGVDTSNLIEEIGATQNSANITATSTTNNLLIILGGGGNAGNGYSGPAINNANFDIQGSYSANGTISYFVGTKIATTTTTNFTFSEAGSGSFWGGREKIIKINAYSEPAPTTDYLLYYGDNPFYVPVNSSFDMPLVYDICSSYDPASYDYGIFLRTATGSVLYTSDWLTACSGTFHFTGTSGMKESLNMGAYFEVVGSGNSTTAASSSPFYFIEYNTVLTGTYIVKNGQGMVFTDTAADAGSTAVAFSYNVCKDPAWSASSKIWLRNKDVNSLTGVSATASTCSGTSTVSLPYSKNLYYYFNADLVFENASSTLSVASEPFIVGFSPLTNTMASSSKDFFGVPLREVACTDEEWAQSASSSPDFSVWTKLKCNTTLTVLTVATTIADLPRVIGQQFVNQFERMFPFNFPFKIKESWDASANVPLEPALSWLDMSDSSGNIYGTMPAKLFKTATDTPFMIFGADMIGAADSPQRVFINNFRSITPFINWIAFIFAIWSFGSKSLFSDLMGNTKETEVKKE